MPSTKFLPKTQAILQRKLATDEKLPMPEVPAPEASASMRNLFINDMDVNRS